MKKLYKDCRVCTTGKMGTLVYMGEFCSDLTGEEKQKAINHLIEKHIESDYILQGLEKVFCRTCEKKTYQLPQSIFYKELLCPDCFIDVNYNKLEFEHFCTKCETYRKGTNEAAKDDPTILFLSCTECGTVFDCFRITGIMIQTWVNIQKKLIHSGVELIK